jgi:galactose mutarotase-like enzyme
MAAFPFPHRLSLEATLRETTLTIATTVHASADVAVPISFGYHPYFGLPGVPRSDWQVEIPVADRLVLDDRGLPTGEHERATVAAGPLGSRTFDDAYLAPEDSAPLTVSGGKRRVEVRFDSGFPYAQVYAPADDDVIALEPMTAPTNALVIGGDDLPLLAPGDAYSATFSVTISDVPAEG